MGYVNLPPSLQSTFQKIDDRVTKVENASRFTLPNVATDPAYPVIGDLWLNTAANDYKFVDASGAVQQVYAASSGPSISGNVAINGGFDFWQRATSGASPSSAYLADRWYVSYDVLDTGSATVDRYLGNAGPGSQYSVRIGAATGAFSGGVKTLLSQVVETANTIALVGRTVTLSAYMMTSDALASTTGVMYLSYSTTVDAAVTSGFTVIGSADFMGNQTGPLRTSLTVTIPSNAQTLLISVSPTNFLYQKANYAYISGVQLEAGETATPFARAGRSIGAELALCQRYYVRYSGINSAGASALMPLTNGAYYIAATCYATLFLPVVMRPASAGITVSSSITGALAVYSAGASRASTAISGTGSLYPNNAFEISVGTSAATAGNAAFVRVVAGEYIDFSAEL